MWSVIVCLRVSAVWSVIVFKGKCSVVCHCVLRVRGLCHCVLRVSAVWSVIVF